MTMKRPRRYTRRVCKRYSFVLISSLLVAIGGAHGQASAVLGDGLTLQNGPESLTLRLDEGDDDAGSSEEAASEPGRRRDAPEPLPLQAIVAATPETMEDAADDTRSPGLRPLVDTATDGTAAESLEKPRIVADGARLPGLAPPSPLAPGSRDSVAAEAANVGIHEWNGSAGDDMATSLGGSTASDTLDSSSDEGGGDDAASSGSGSVSTSGLGSTSSSSNGKVRRVFPGDAAAILALASGGAGAGGAAGQGDDGPASDATLGLVDVQAGLERLRSIEVMMERNLEELLRAVYGSPLDDDEESTAERQNEREIVAEDPSSASEGEPGSAPAGGTPSKASARNKAAADERLRAVQRQFGDIRAGLQQLLMGINATSAGVTQAGQELKARATELKALQHREEEDKILEGLNDGTLKVDYETGKIAIAPRPANGNGTAALTVEQVIVQQREDFEQLKEDADPAVLHMDNVMLRDVVVLSMAAAVGGAIAATLRIPHTLGYILGGMAVGPTGLHLISKVVEAETFAQFGSIFLLFGHGLAYSRHSNAARTGAGAGGGTGAAGQAAGAGSGGIAAAAAAIAGPLLSGDGSGRLGAFTVLFVCYSALVFFLTLTGACDTFERVFLAAAATLSSTAVVTEFVGSTGLNDSVFARMVIDLVGVQDLVMCPLLAVPTAIMHLVWDFGGIQTFIRLALYSLIVVGSAVLARRVLPAAMRVLAHGPGSHGPGGASPPHSLKDGDVPGLGIGAALSLQQGGPHPQGALGQQLQQMQQGQHNSLFLLGVVAYCLAFALMCESLKLSHEAGALFAGLLMFDSPHAARAAASVDPLTSFFGGIYLASLGMIVNPAYVAANIGAIGACVLVVAGLKFAVVVGVMRSFGFSLPAAVMAGGCMAQVSEISLFFVARAQQIGLISRQLYLMMVATTVVLLSVSPFLVAAVRRLDMSMKHFESAPAALTRSDSDGGNNHMGMGRGEARLGEVEAQGGVVGAVANGGAHAPSHGPSHGGHKRRHRFVV